MVSACCSFSMDWMCSLALWTDVKLKGPSSAVQSAKEHIQSMLKEQHAETIEVPSSCSAGVLGGGGGRHGHGLAGVVDGDLVVVAQAAEDLAPAAPSKALRSTSSPC
jgi:dihydroxyacetone kinase